MKTKEPFKTQKKGLFYMTETKSVYQFKEKSKRVIFAAILLCLSGTIGLVFSSVGLFAGGQKLVAILEYLLAATLIAASRQNVPVASLGGVLIVWALVHCFLSERITVTADFLSLLSGVLIIFMTCGILETKIFVNVTSILNVVLALVGFADTFRRFFLVDYFHDGIFPTDSEIMYFAITEVRNIGNILIAISILICISALCPKVVPAVKKNDGRNTPIIPMQNSSMTNTTNLPQKFCSHCGEELLPQAVVCPHCGCAVGQLPEADIPSKGLNVLSFFIPLVGLILFCVFYDKTPTKAKAIGKWAIIGFSISLGFSVLLYLILLL